MENVTDDEFFRYLIDRASRANERGDWPVVAWYLALMFIASPGVFLESLWELATEGGVE